MGRQVSPVLCPRCQRRYHHGTLLCLHDGTPLVVDREGAAVASDVPASKITTAPTQATLPTALARPEPRKPRERSPQLSAETLESGTQLGDYELGDVLGEGGMATVYAGTHPLIGKRVAIKVLHERYAQDPAIVERFLREAQAVNQIDSEQLTDIFAVGSLEDGRPYLVMDLLEGETLSELIRREGPLSLDLLLPVALDVARALVPAHQTGIVHRDLKPSNIMVRRDEASGLLNAKVVDFGIAKLLRDDSLAGADPADTQSGVAIGTGPYMSPEQLAGREIDHRTDIFAFGVTLYRALAGQLPFDATSLTAIALQQRNSTPKALSELRDDLPQPLVELLHRCLAPDPQKRPKDMREVLGALVAVQAQQGSRKALAADLPRRSLGPWLLLAAVLLVALGGAFVYVWLGGGAAVRSASQGSAGDAASGHGELLLITEVPDATYAIDGALIGSGARLHLPRLAAGRHRLEVRAPGHRRLRRDLLVFDGQAQTLRLQLRPREMPWRRHLGPPPPSPTR